MITTTDDPSPFEQFYGKPSPLVNKLRTAKQHQSKLTNRGKACIFVGYTEHHSHSSYRMINLRTHHVIVSRDIIWLNQMHGEDTPTNLIPPHEDELFEEDIETQPDNVPSGQPHDPAPVQAPVPATAQTPRLPRELRNLQSDLAPQLLEPGNRQTGRERLNLMLDDYLPDFAFLTALVSEAMHEHDEEDDDVEIIL